MYFPAADFCQRIHPFIVQKTTVKKVAEEKTVAPKKRLPGKDCV